MDSILPRGLIWALVVCVAMASSIDNEYIKNHCNEMMTLDPDQSLKLQLKRDFTSTSDCVIQVNAGTNQRIVVQLSKFDMYSPDYVELRDGRSSSSSFVSGFYEKQDWSKSYTTKTSQTTGQYLYIHVYAPNSIVFQSSFNLILTSFHTGFCDSDEYSCNNGRCISSSVTCNGYNVCGDNSDCPLVLAVGAIIGIVISGIVVTTIIVVIVILLRRRRPAVAGTFVQSPGVQTQQYPPAPYGQPPQPAAYTVQASYPIGQAPYPTTGP